jgi:hypothetical protein
MMDNEKLEQAIVFLRAYYNTVDNILYEHYTKESLGKELSQIEESISYLESLMS